MHFRWLVFGRRYVENNEETNPNDIIVKCNMLISIWFICLLGESTRKSYVKRMNTPALSTENCNATANYAGSLPDDLVCIEDAGNENDTKCQINVSFRLRKLRRIQMKWKISLISLIFWIFQTDEGAPLLCYSNTKSSWQMKGILSYRSGCRRHALPAVYSQFTPSILKWITKTIGNDVMIERRNG